STTPADEFAGVLGQVMDFQEWMRYFAVISLMEYSETALGNGYGDDYSMYRGMKDTRFLILAHDFDTIFGQGDTAGNITENIFLAAQSGRAVLTNLFYNPELTPIYYGELDRLLNTTFSPEQLFPIFERYLTGLVPDATIVAMKTFATNRNAYIRSQIPAAITISFTNGVVNGYPQATAPFVNLNGR